MLNHPRGTSLERLSGWIRTTGGLPVTSSRARANRCCVHTTAEGDSDGSHSDAVPLGLAAVARPGGHQAVPVDLPAGQASGSPGHGWVPLEFGNVRPSRGTLATRMWPPGWQVLQVAQTVALPCHGPPTDFTPSQPDCSQTATVSAGLIHTRNDSDRQRFIFSTDRIYYQQLVESLGDAKRGSLFYKPCIIPNFESVSSLRVESVD